MSIMRVENAKYEEGENRDESFDAVDGKVTLDQPFRRDGTPGLIGGTGTRQTT